MTVANANSQGSILGTQMKGILSSLGSLESLKGEHLNRILKNIYSFIYSAALGLSCRNVESRSPTRDQPSTPSIGSTES